MSDEKLQRARDACGQALRQMWERDARKAPPEKRERYVLSFECAPSVLARILQFVREQPTARRSFRRYEIGSNDDG